MPNDYNFEYDDVSKPISTDVRDLIKEYCNRLYNAQLEILSTSGLSELPPCTPRQIAAILSSNPKNHSLPTVTPGRICVFKLQQNVDVRTAFSKVLPEQIRYTSDSKGTFLALDKKTQTAIDLLFTTLAKHGIVIKECSTDITVSQVFMSPTDNSNNRILFFHQLGESFFLNLDGFHAGTFSGGNGFQTNFIGLRNNPELTVQEIALLALHEFLHALSFKHIMPFGIFNEQCVREYVAHATVAVNLLRTHRCFIDGTNSTSSSAMNCMLTSGQHEKTFFEISPADRIAIMLRLKYIQTGDPKYLFPSGIPSQNSNSHDLSTSHKPLKLPANQIKDGIIDARLVLSSEFFDKTISPPLSSTPKPKAHPILPPNGPVTDVGVTSIKPTRTGLHQRRTPRGLQQEQYLVQSIAQQPVFDEILGTTLEAFFISFAMGALNELSKYSPFVAINQKTQETLIRFAVHSIYYGLPTAIFSESITYSVDYLTNYMMSKNSEKCRQLIKYFAPILPVLINIIIKCYKTGNLLYIIQAPAAIAAGFFGSLVGKNTIAACAAMLGSQPKLKTD